MAALEVAESAPPLPPRDDEVMPAAECDRPKAPRAWRQGPRRAAAWQHLVVATLVLGGGLLYLALFSALPGCVGEVVHEKLVGKYEHSMLAVGSSVLALVMLLALDVHNWVGRWWYLGALLGVMVGALVAWTALMATNVFAAALPAFFLLGAPFVLMGLKSTVLKSMDLLSFLDTLEVSLLLLSMLSLGAWLAWIVAEQQWWNLENKLEFYERMDCSAVTNYTIAAEMLGLEANVTVASLQPADREVLDLALVGCTAAFLLWLQPFILFVWSFVFCAVVFFLARVLHQAQTAKDEAHAMDPLAQAFLMLLSLGVFGMWAAAGIAGGEMKLGNVLLSLTFLALIIVLVVVMAIFGTNVLKEAIGSTPLGLRMVKTLESDWARALLLILLSPLFVLYLPVAMLRQASRKFLVCTARLDAEDRGVLPASLLRQIEVLRTWRWTSVLIKALWWCVLFFLLVVGVVRVATLFLSWLNEALGPVSLGITSLAFFGVGILMFLNPFIPGVPVYLSGGIILVSSARDEFGFWGAVLFAIGFCFMLKMLAIVMQQKLIGEMYASKKVWIRKLVGVNSTEIRAIRDILLKPGINFRKVTILCGGPDWPVSVLTGILRLPLGSMLLGSVPVVLLIAPTVLAGALLLRSGEGSAWASLSTIMLWTTALVQSLAMLAAIHFIAKTIIEKEEELRALPDDEDVRALELKNERRAQIREEISDWSRQSLFTRVMLVISCFCMVCSCYVFQLMGSACFVPFQVYDSIDVKLDGNPLKIIKPLGFAALGIFACAFVYLVGFNKYLDWQVAATLRAESGSTLSVSADAPSASATASGDAPRAADGEAAVERAALRSILRRNYFCCLDSKGN